MRRQPIRRFWLFLILALSAACASVREPVNDRFLSRSVVIGGERYNYRVWLPPRYTRLRRWPMILYLHGSGERGDDNYAPLTSGLPDALMDYGSRYPFVVVIPQCRDGFEWYGPMEQQALAALEASIVEFRGDRRRVVLTGISMGGAGAWYMARLPDRFAGVVPVSAEVVRQDGDPFPQPLPPDLAAILHAQDARDTLARAIGAMTPVWAFHGADDEEIPADESRWMVAALRAIGNPVRYTEYPATGHNSWDRAYSDPQLPAWMLQRQLPSPSPAGR
jgi:predicted peptidase